MHSCLPQTRALPCLGRCFACPFPPCSKTRALPGAGLDFYNSLHSTRTAAHAALPPRPRDAPNSPRQTTPCACACVREWWGRVERKDGQGGHTQAPKNCWARGGRGGGGGGGRGRGGEAAGPPTCPATHRGSVLPTWPRDGLPARPSTPRASEGQREARCEALGPEGQCPIHNPFAAGGGGGEAAILVRKNPPPQDPGRRHRAVPPVRSDVAMPAPVCVGGGKGAAADQCSAPSSKKLWGGMNAAEEVRRRDAPTVIDASPPQQNKTKRRHPLAQGKARSVQCVGGPPQGVWFIRMGKGEGAVDTTYRYESISYPWPLRPFPWRF